MNINFIIDKHHPKITGIATLENSDEYYRFFGEILVNSPVERHLPVNL